jgi:hypothetical protein
MTRTRQLFFASIVAGLLTLSACADSSTAPSAPSLDTADKCEIQGGNSRSC